VGSGDRRREAALASGQRQGGVGLRGLGDLLFSDADFATGGTIYGMVKTTLYLPDELKAKLTRAAVRRGEPEAEVIRKALRKELESERPRPRGGLFAGAEPIADRVDELLSGFGAA